MFYKEDTLLFNGKLLVMGMTMKYEIEEQTRRLLPWYLAPRFHNVITSVKIKDSSVIMRRNVEVYTTSSSPMVFVPLASMMLYTPYMEVEYNVRVSDVNLSDRIANIVKVKGFVSGYLPDGRYTKFTERAFADKVFEKEIVVEGEPSPFMISMVARRVARIESAKYFANKVRYELTKSKKWWFEPVGKGRVKVINVVEGNAMTKMEISTTFFDVRYKDYEPVTTPGIVAGVAHYFGNDETIPIENDKVKDFLIDFVKRIADVGKSFTPISVLNKVNRSTFSYVIGDAEIPDHVKVKLTGKDKPLWHWVTSTSVYRGVKTSFYVDPASSKVIMSVTFLPFYPPASLVLNYPPFHLAPLSAVVNERLKQLKYMSDRVEKALLKEGIEAVLYPDELEPLSDAGVTFDEIKDLMKRGYPPIRHLEGLLEKMDRVSYLTDVAGLTLGKIQKVDEMLISSITPKKKASQVSEEPEDEFENKNEGKRVKVTL